MLPPEGSTAGPQGMMPSTEQQDHTQASSEGMLSNAQHAQSSCVGGQTQTNASHTSPMDHPAASIKRKRQDPAGTTEHQQRQHRIIAGNMLANTISGLPMTATWTLSADTTNSTLSCVHILSQEYLGDDLWDHILAHLVGRGQPAWFAGDRVRRLRIWLLEHGHEPPSGPICGNSSSPVAGQGSKAMHLNHCISFSVGPVLQTRWRLDMSCLAHWVPVSASDKIGCCVALLKARHVLLTQEAGRSEVGLSRLGAQATHAFDHILLASFVTHCYKVMQQPALAFADESSMGFSTSRCHQSDRILSRFFRPEDAQRHPSHHAQAMHSIALSSVKHGALGQNQSLAGLSFVDGFSSWVGHAVSCRGDIRGFEAETRHMNTLPTDNISSTFATCLLLDIGAHMFDDCYTQCHLDRLEMGEFYTAQDRCCIQVSWGHMAACYAHLAELMMSETAYAPQHHILYVACTMLKSVDQLPWSWRQRVYTHVLSGRLGHAICGVPGHINTAFYMRPHGYSLPLMSVRPDLATMSLSPARDPYGRAPLPRRRHRALARETEEIHIRPPLPRRPVTECSSMVPEKESDQHRSEEAPSQPVQLVHLTLANGKEVLLKSQARSVYDAQAKGSGRISKPKRTVPATSVASRPKHFAVERWHRQMAAAASKSVLRLETQTDADLKQDKLDQKVGQAAKVPKQGVIQTKAKSKPKKRPPPVGTIAEALKRKRLGAGAGTVSSKSSTDRVIDASFWARRLKPSAKSSASSAYDTIRDTDKDKADLMHPAQKTPPADKDGISSDVQTSNKGARQKKSKRAVYTFAFVLAWGLVASLLQFSRHHSERRISAFRQLARFPTGTHGARWTSKWFPNIRQNGACQNTKLLYATLTSDGFMYYGRSTSHSIYSHPLSRAWRWIWCHDDSQTWGIVRSIRGAYKALAHFLRRDVPLGFTLLTYMLFILVCMEIIADLLLGIRVRLHGDPPRLQRRTPINFFRHEVLIHMGVRYSYGSLARASQRATQGLIHHVPGHHVKLAEWPMKSCQDIPSMDRSGIPSGRHLVLGLLLGRGHGARLFSSQLAGSLRVVYYGMRSAFYNMGLSGPKSGCSGTTSLVQPKSTAAEVRVWPCASGQEPGVSIQSMHDNMSGKPRVTLSHWFQEYCSFGRAILRTGQRLIIRRWHQVSTKHAVQLSVHRVHKEKQSRPKRHASSKTTRTWSAQVWTFMLAVIYVMGRAMRMWLTLYMLLFHVVNTANAGASPAITGREINPLWLTKHGVQQHLCPSGHSPLQPLLAFTDCFVQVRGNDCYKAWCDQSLHNMTQVFHLQQVTQQLTLAFADVSSMGASTCRCHQIDKILIWDFWPDDALCHPRHHALALHFIASFCGKHCELGQNQHLAGLSFAEGFSSWVGHDVSCRRAVRRIGAETDHMNTPPTNKFSSTLDTRLLLDIGVYMLDDCCTLCHLDCIAMDEFYTAQDRCCIQDSWGHMAACCEHLAELTMSETAYALQHHILYVAYTMLKSVDQMPWYWRLHVYTQALSGRLGNAGPCLWEPLHIYGVPVQIHTVFYTLLSGYFLPLNE